MKIQKLTIHNIASIEDATIEFDKEPLASESLFLITGETGSGKTTILNAICLALYNTSPNLKQIGSAEEDAEGVQTNNPRQLMRRGTTEAIISLTFEGNDEKHYEATWSVKRAHNKTSGTLQNVKRTLQCKETHLAFQKETDIKQTIQEAVGLTFEQFCRTTMLAQGQFSKFMNSEEKDKAEILEKLTGTEIYTRIGKKIFELSKNKNREFERINNQIEGAQLLSEETLTEYTQQITLLERQYTEQTISSQKLDIQLRWLTEVEKKQKDIEQCQKELQALQKRASDKDIQEKKTLLQTWEDTIDIRNILKNRTEAEQELVNRQKQQTEQNNKFTELLAGFNELNQQLQNTRQEIKDCQKEIDNERDNAPMYAAANRIEEYVKTLNDKETSLQTYQKNLSENQLKLQILSEKWRKIKQAADKAESTYKEQEELVKKLREETEHINLQELAETVSNGKEKINSLQSAINAVKTYIEKAEDYSTESNYLEKNKEQLTIEEDNYTNLSEQLATANTELLEQENQYRGKQDLCDHITELQIQFQKNHICPLCGSHVNSLHTDEILKETLLEAKKLQEAARYKRDRIQQAYAQTKANIKSLKEICTNGIIKLKQKKEALDNAAQQAITETAPFQTDYKTSDTITHLEQQLIAVKLQNEKEEQIQKESYSKKEQLGKAELLLTQYHSDIDATQKICQKHQEDTHLLNTQTAHQKGLAEQAEKDIQTILTEFKHLVTIEVNWNNIDYNRLNTTIQNKALLYNDNNNRLIRLNQQEQQLAIETTSASETINSLQKLFPKTGTTATKEIPQLNQALRNFSNDINLLQGAIQQSKIHLESITEETNLYFKQNPELSESVIKQLMQIPINTIDKYKQEIKQLQVNIQQKQGACQQLREQQENHNRQKPPLPAEATIESLTLSKKDIETILKTTHEEKIKLQTILNNDTEHRQLLAHKKDLLEQLRHEKDNWNQLDYLFGGAQGDKFKKIAQSYVLRALLEKANYYLQMLSNRYELECSDGSLTINVIDNHQGGAIRNVGLLSGGEGFIVSLALALGLSAISKDKINVDTLFIDEGFGTLSNEYLEIVINTLDRLHQFGGRRVGIISHVAELATRIHTQIQVKRTGPSSSKINVTTD